MEAGKGCNLKLSSACSGFRICVRTASISGGQEGGELKSHGIARVVRHMRSTPAAALSCTRLQQNPVIPTENQRQQQASPVDGSLWLKTKAWWLDLVQAAFANRRTPCTCNATANSSLI